MLTRRAITTASLLLFAFASQQSTPPSRIRASELPRPSVYLSFEKVGPRKPQFRTESGEGVWLRLHNNTPRPLILHEANTDLTSVIEQQLKPNIRLYFAKDGAELKACYDVDGIPTITSKESKDDSGRALSLETEIPYRKRPPEQSPLTSCFWDGFSDISTQGLRLGAGDSILFTVPRNFLSKGLRISTRYNYDWEADENGYVKYNEPEHRVFFTFSQLQQDQIK
jgi:hypothetical protein